MAGNKHHRDRAIDQQAPLADCGFAGIDFESAGSSGGATDEPVQVGLGVMESAGGSIDQLFRSYLSPASEVVWRSGRVHGITPQDLVGAPALVELWGEIDPRLRRRVVLAHGAGTEKKFLRAFPLHGFGPWLDTLMLARRTLPGLADHSLRTCCTALGLEDEARVICAPVCGGLDWHDALFDTVACMLLFRAVITSLDLWDLPVSGLVEMGVVKGL